MKPASSQPRGTDSEIREGAERRARELDRGRTAITLLGGEISQRTLLAGAVFVLTFLIVWMLLWALLDVLGFIVGLVVATIAGLAAVWLLADRLEGRR